MSASTLIPTATPTPGPSARTGLVFAGDDFYMPAWVGDLSSFRRWCLSPDYPKFGQIDYLNGEIWVDLSMEKFFSHNQIRGRIGFVLQGIIDSTQSGRFIPDRMRLVNESADLSCEPDGAFATYETFRSGHLRINEAADELELVGTPDMVLEVVSKSSMRKDTVLLRDLYYRAGVKEYWLVDARKDPLRFDIMMRTDSGFQATLAPDGWSKSDVFSREFRLVKTTDPLGDVAFRLEVR